MKTSMIFANNETQLSATKALKHSANTSIQSSFSHLYTKEISNKNSANSTQKSEQKATNKSDNLAKKPSNESHESVHTEDKVSNEDSETTSPPAPETNLAIISLLDNANQFASQLHSPISTEAKPQDTDLSITGLNSSADPYLQNAEVNTSTLAGDIRQTSTPPYSESEGGQVRNQGEQDITDVGIDGKIDNARTRVIGAGGLKDIENNAIRKRSEESQITSKSATDLEIPTDTKDKESAFIETRLEKSQVEPKSLTELNERQLNPSQEKKPTQFEVPLNRPIESQLLSIEADKERQQAPETAAPGIQASAQTALLSNNPETLISAKTTLTPHVGTNGWDRALGQKVVWMIAGAMQSAELSLNPPDLGPLQVVINVSNDQASANFYSAQPEVREALESALPRLRQMLNDAGVQLSNFSVGTEASQQGSKFSDERPNSGRRTNTSNSSTIAGTVTNSPSPAKGQSKQGLVDTFA